MSGGNWEGIAAYVLNGHENLEKYGADLANGLAKYKDVYQAEKQWIEGSPDAAARNYALSTPTKGKYGDAVWEISSKSDNPYKDSWYGDFSNFPRADNLFFGRGDSCNATSGAGVFCFGWTAGVPYINNGFRVVVPVL